MGGKNEFGKWNWSDNSTWGYTQNLMQGRDGDVTCVYSTKYSWNGVPCTDKYSFICQKKRAFIGKKTINLEYMKDQLNFTTFHVWYELKAASQQLLDSWKDKRMTGFRLSWRIDYEHLPLIASTNQVGRSIQTPGLGNIMDASSDKMYKAILHLS